jgi:hypothetical protein
MEADKIMLPDTKSTAPDEPVEITQTLTTISPQAVRLPSDLGLAGQHARVAVTRPVRPGGMPQPLEEGARRIGAVIDQYPDQAVADYLRRLHAPIVRRLG